MGKAPATQFYIKDWLTDPELRLACLSTRGIWIDLLCFMWQAKNKGELELTEEQIAKLTGANNGEVETFLAEAEEFKFCDMSRDVTKSHSKVTIINRRMSREYKAKENARLRKQRQRARRAGHKEVTPPSPTPSSPSSPKKREKPWPDDFFMDQKMKDYALKNNIDPNKIDAFFDDFHNWALSKGATYIDWKAAFRTRVQKAPELGKQFLKFREPAIHKQDEPPKYKDANQVLKEKGML